MGGGSPDNSGAINAIDFITLATTGNAQDFGDLSANRDAGNCLCLTNQRSFYWWRRKSPNTPVNTMEYVTIATTGNPVDFGDLDALKKELSGMSNGHGGL